MSVVIRDTLKVCVLLYKRRQVMLGLDSVEWTAIGEQSLKAP